MTASIGSGARRKGATFQRAIRAYLNRCGLDPMNRSGGEEGDDMRLLRCPDVSIELKNQTRVELASWMAQAKQSAAGKIAILIVKRVGYDADRDPGRQWVVMELADLVRLLGDRSLPAPGGLVGGDQVVGTRVGDNGLHGGLRLGYSST